MLEEARSGNPEAAAKRMTALEGIPLLDVSDAAIKLADKLSRIMRFPRRQLKMRFISRLHVFMVWTICLLGIANTSQMHRCIVQLTRPVGKQGM